MSSPVGAATPLDNGSGGGNHNLPAARAESCFPTPRRPAGVPLGLYLHLPWCRSKCPYCDFNAHAATPREAAYCAALERDLEIAAPRVAGRRIGSVYFGGGTPSLFSPHALERILDACAARLCLEESAEISLEANPESATRLKLKDYRQLGVNRLSLGVQSFSTSALQELGRAHDARRARRAVRDARRAGFDNLNLDLMYGLPGRTAAQTLQDLSAALEFEPEHLSWYQLTLEPGTVFAHRPPRALPGGGALETMEQEGYALLESRGYRRYEVSAWARPGRECRHNLNYWRFGDYLGLGAGAHGKLSLERAVERESRPPSPVRYMREAGTASGWSARPLRAADLRLEFFLNALRLPAGVASGLWRQRTGLPLSAVREPLEQARARGWLCPAGPRIQPTEAGLRWLNELLELFLPETRAARPRHEKLENG